MAEMEVGFLGLGIMGKAMALNLLRNGFRVTVWNRTPSRCEELVEHGASVGETPAAVIQKCKYTVAMLSDPSAALSVVFDEHGVLEQITKGKGYIDMSTVDAETSSKISEAITEKGGHFLEAPVSGSKKPAEDGQLVILAAGEKTLYEEVIHIFDVLGKKSFFLGSVGNGAKLKLVVNMIMGSMMNAFAEGLVLAGRSGLSQQTLLDVLVRRARYDRREWLLLLLLLLLLQFCLEFSLAGPGRHRQPNVQAERARHDQQQARAQLPSEASAEGHEAGASPWRRASRVDARCGGGQRVLQEGEELGAGRGGLLRGVRGAQGLVCRRRGVMQPVGLFCIPLPSRALEPR